MKKRYRSVSTSSPKGERFSPELDTLALLDLAPVLSRDLQDRIIHWGHGTQALYGYSPEEALGQVSHQLLKTRFPRPLEEIQADLLAHGCWKGELTHTCKDGASIVVASEWVFQRDSKGDPCVILEVNQDITESKKAEQVVLQSEENLRTIFNSVADGIVVHAIDGTVLEVNQRFRSMYGIDFERGAKLSIAELSSPSNPLDLLPKLWAKVIAGENQHFQWKARRPRDGSEFDVEVCLSRIRLRDADAILANISDITQRKRIEEQLRLQSSALQASAHAIIITGRNGLIQWVNPAFTRLTGYEAEEVFGRSPRLLKSHAHPQAFYQAMWETILAGRVWRGELVNKRKDGSLYTEEMTITPVTDLAGEITHFIAAKQDISERKHVEQTILRQNQRLSILNAAAEALLSATNAEAALAVIYDRMAEYFGIDGFIEFHLNSAGDALELVASKAVAEARQPSITRLQLGQGIAGKVAQTRRPILVANAQASSDPALQFVKELGAHAYACEPLIIGDRLLGTLSFSSCRRENFDDEDQDFFRTLANYIALAKERLRLNEELQQHASRLEQTVRDRTAQLIEANANLQTFAYTAAHDLRSPLRSIRNFSSLAVEDFGPQLGSEGKFYLEKVAQSADQMAKLLNDLLEYSKIIQIELRLEKVQLAKAIEEALVLLQDDIQNTGAEISVVEPMPAVLGHSATITLIIANFVANALKFMPAGILPKVRIWAEPAGGLIRLWVQDNGIGIEPQDRQKLFQLFQRLHGKGAYPGTGLGLAIVRRAVERMGGHVGVESEKGKGSRFWAEFKLPEDGTA